MTSISGTRPPAAMPQPKALDQAGEAPTTTPIEDHIAFFKSLSRDGMVDAEGTRRGLAALGLNMASTAVGGHVLTVPFAVPQQDGNGVLAKLKAAATGALEISRIKEGVRGPDAKTGKPTDTAIYTKSGGLNADAFMAQWKEFAGDKGYMNDDDIKRLVQGKPVNALEFGLLMELGGQISTEGKRVLTADRALAFYDGSLFAGLAKARTDNVLFKPTGEIKHDGAKEIAKRLSSLALQNGGAAAGDAAKSLYGAKLAIDQDASLAYQQKEKSLWPTFELAAKTAVAGGPAFNADAALTQSIGPNLAGTFKAMCPAGKG